MILKPKATNQCRLYFAGSSVIKGGVLMIKRSYIKEQSFIGSDVYNEFY